jgi:hypothetical protein
MSPLSRLLPAACILLLQALAGCAPLQPSAILATQVDSAGRPLNESSTFTVDAPRILCSLSTQGLSASSEVSAAWSYYDGTSWRALKDDRLTVGNSAYLVFALEAPATGWATGSYRIRLLTAKGTPVEKAFTLKTDPSVNLPSINNFSVTPGTVTAGQQFTLSWNVSGASRVVITPDIGSVDAGGSRLLSASSDKTYVLTAINSGGSSSMSINLKSVPPEFDKSDLVIVDVFREVSMVYYKVRNNGSAVSKPCSAVLYVGPTKLATDYIAPLNPGQERTEVFGTFSWGYRQDTPVAICLDIDSQNGESNRQENCLIKLLPGERGL